MALLANHILFLLPVVGVVGCLVAALLSSPHVQAHERERAKQCRYCRWGQAVLIKESVSREGDDLVQTFLYGCRNCGLPQWTVERTPLTQNVP